MSLGLIVAAGLAGLSGYWGATQPAPPPDFDSQAAVGSVAQHLDQLTPALGYQMWVEQYLPLQRLTEVTDPREEAAAGLHRAVRGVPLGGAGRWRRWWPC